MRTTGDDSIGFNESRTARFKKIYKLDSIQQDRDDCQCEIISEASLKYDQTIQLVGLFRTDNSGIG